MFIVVRVDGHGFTKFFLTFSFCSDSFLIILRLCNAYAFLKPNDERALNIMNFAAVAVMQEFTEIVCAYGQSDEYSFLFPKNAKCFLRRATFVPACALFIFVFFQKAFDSRLLVLFRQLRFRMESLFLSTIAKGAFF
jgi:tRNA(His) guanylyltransferase